MSKKANLTVVLLFILFLFVLFILNLFWPVQVFSEKENRYLQSFPSFSFSSLKSGEYTARIEDYCSDHFIGRDGWISLKARMELLQGKRENNGVFLCTGERLIEPFTDPGAAETERRINTVNEFTNRIPVPVVFALIPTSAEVYSGLLPPGVSNDSQKSFISSVYSRVNADTADVIGALTLYSDGYVFYRTDHHWTSFGASCAFSALAESMQISEQNDYHIRIVSDSFLGTAYSSSGFFWIHPDTMETYIDVSENIIVERYESEEPEIGKVYASEMLNTKDKYRFFLGGNSPRIVIRTGKEDRPSLLIIRDSFADSLVPFFLEYYSEIHLLDLRYYRDSAAEYVSQYGIDSVLILYSTANFISDNGILMLNR